MSEVLYFNINFDCNNSCLYCFSHNTAQKAPYSISVSDIVSAVKRSHALNDDDCRLIINGGEPTVHPDFQKIVRSLSRSDNPVLFSNGCLLSIMKDYQLESLANTFCQITIPFHGSRRTHDAITRRIGSFDEALLGAQRIIEHIRADCCRFEVKFIINQAMIESKFSISAFMHDMGFTPDCVSVTLAGQVNTKVAQSNCLPFVEQEVLGRYVSAELNKLIGVYNLKILDVPFCVLDDSVAKNLLVGDCLPDDVLNRYWYFDGKHRNGHLVKHYDLRHAESRCALCLFHHYCRSITESCRVFSLSNNGKYKLAFE